MTSAFNQAPFTKPRFLVTGASGQVGEELIRVLARLGEVVAPGRDALNMVDAASIEVCIRAVRPRWIVNAGAYTAVDRAESEAELAYAINAEALRVIGREARSSGAGVIHFSTDYVFDGAGSRPFLETDATGPLGVYGASKLAGEQILAETRALSFILRTSWVYGATGKNFVRTILKLARERETLRVVGDQYGAPTWSRDLARLAAHVIGHCERATGERRDALYEAAGPLGGIYHASGAGETTWAGFAEEAIRLTREREPGVDLATVTPIASSEYSTPAVRPQNSRLNCEKLLHHFGWRMMDWRESLAQVVAELG